MSYSPPTAPETLPDDIAETLDEYSAALLRDVARYAEDLAEHREREARLAAEDEEDEQIEERTEELPDDVPSKATITIKEINDNRYYYWQWRDGGEIKSKYKAPVDADS
jgi:antirestriction protein